MESKERCPPGAHWPGTCDLWRVVQLSDDRHVFFNVARTRRAGGAVLMGTAKAQVGQLGNFSFCSWGREEMMRNAG